MVCCLVQREALYKMEEHVSTLRKCIQAAADDQVPSAFVILPAPGTIEEEIRKVHKELSEAKGDLERGARERKAACLLKFGNRRMSNQKHAYVFSSKSCAMLRPRTDTHHRRSNGSWPSNRL